MVFDSFVDAMHLFFCLLYLSRSRVCVSAFRCVTIAAAERHESREAAQVGIRAPADGPESHTTASRRAPERHSRSKAASSAPTAGSCGGSSTGRTSVHRRGVGRPLIRALGLNLASYFGFVKMQILAERFPAPHVVHNIKHLFDIIVSRPINEGLYSVGA